LTVDHRCDLCGNPVGPSEYVCERCTSETARYLRDAELAGEVETTVALQARYAVSGGRRAADAYPDDPPGVSRPQIRAETFGWAASREQPERNALRPGRLIVDLNASAKAAHAFNAVTTWARHVEETRGEQAPDVQRGQHPVAVAAAWLLGQLDWLRHQREAEEAFTQLQAAGATIRRIVDRPPDQQIVGVCDCGTRLYAYAGAATCTCPNAACALRWDVHESRDRMWDAVHGYLYTANEAALLLMIHGLGGYSRRKWAKRITMWHQRNLITPRGEIDGSPAYLFADIYERATRSEDRLSA
jgi:hypothetical protein